MNVLRLILFGMFLLGGQVLACEVCMGSPDDPQTQGMQGAIITLLLITYATLLTIIAVAFYLFKTNRKRLELQGVRHG